MVPAAAQVQSSSNHSITTPDQRPNIVLILADDLGYGSLGCYLNNLIRENRELADDLMKLQRQWIASVGDK